MMLSAGTRWEMIYHIWSYFTSYYMLMLSISNVLYNVSIIHLIDRNLGTASPTSEPTSPTNEPTAPSYNPTAAPTVAPSLPPSRSPSSSPSIAPSDSPTYSPSKAPSTSPSDNPTAAPSVSPLSLLQVMAQNAEGEQLERVSGYTLYITSGGAVFVIFTAFAVMKK